MKKILSLAICLGTTSMLLWPLVGYSSEENSKDNSITNMDSNLFNITDENRIIILKNFIDKEAEDFLRRDYPKAANLSFILTYKQGKYFLTLAQNDTPVYQLSFIFHNDDYSVYRNDFAKIGDIAPNDNETKPTSTMLTSFFHYMMDNLGIEKIVLHLVPNIIKGTKKPASYNGKINWEAGYDFQWGEKQDTKEPTIYPYLKIFFKYACPNLTPGEVTPSEQDMTKELLKDSSILYYLPNANKAFDMVVLGSKVKDQKPSKPFSKSDLPKAAAKMVRLRKTPKRSAQESFDIPRLNAEVNVCWRKNPIIKQIFKTKKWE